MGQDRTDSRGQGRFFPLRSRSQLQRLVLSLIRLAGIQVRLWMLRTELAFWHACSLAALALVALVTLLLGLVFLYMGLFLALSRLIGPIGSFLVFAALHLALATGLFLMARRLMASWRAEPASLPARL